LGLDEASGEAAVPGINREKVYEHRLPVLDLEQQRTIANYLDVKTTELDSLVENKKWLLQLLYEKRRALIAHAVTRGLNLDAPCHESAIPWLGTVPAHWEVERSRWLFNERDDRSEFGDEELLTVSHLTGVTSRADKDVNMFMAESLEGYKCCEPGDLVINTLCAWMGAMGTARQAGIVSPAYNVYQPTDRLDPAYVDLLVRMPRFVEEVTRYSKGVWSSRLRLYPEGLYEVWFPVPPIDEQKQIVAYVHVEARKLDELAAASENTIALLQERRSALIADAVTGQY
jgi:type I restriction enzyme S subunit